MSEAVVLIIRADQQELKLQNPKMKLEKISGEHSQMELSGVVLPDSQADVQRIVPESDLQVSCKGHEKIMFRGMVVYADINVETGVTDSLKEIHIKAMSYSSQLDRERKNRAFQNSAESYQSVCRLLLKDYPDSGIIMSPETDGKVLGTLAVQYYETDWEFLSRLAARLNQPLFVSSCLKGPKLFFGTVWGSTCCDITEQEKSEVEEIHVLGRKDQPGLDAFCWETHRTDQKVLEVGDMIRYKQVIFYIREAEISVENHAISHRYTFCGKDGFFVPSFQNQYITGLSIPGAIKGVSGNMVQVDLDIDALTENDQWYAYATFYSMFYCMPEKGDRVYLYFPEAQEGAAFVLNSVRGSSNGKENASTVAESSGNGSDRKTTEALMRGHGQGDSMIDITPYIDQLAAPAGGQLVDLKIAFDGGPYESMRDILSGPAGGQGSSFSGQEGRGVPPVAQQDYDFDSLSSDDKIKVLATPDGKMIVLNDRTGTVTVYLDASTYVSLNSSGITVRAGKNITLWADGNINLNAKKSIILEAEEEMKIRCKASEIDMMPEEVTISGNDLRLNP